MIINKHLITLLFIAISSLAFSQTSWYVSKEVGSNSNNGQDPNNPFKTVDNAVTHLNPGDTLFIMGEYSNDNYDHDYSFEGDINDPHIWLQEHSFKITNLNGNANAYITIKSYDENTVIKGDAANIIRITHSSYLRIEGLNIYGEVENIPLSTALALQFLYIDPNTGEVVYRVPPGTSDEEVANMTFPDLGNVQRPSYTDTRGIYFTNVDHIDIINNTIHHTPGGGLRVAEGEYINIISNEIHNCSRKSYSGTHALVVTKSKSSNTLEDYKINVLRNKVHHNYNEIYSWAPTKTFITPRIDEGKGISLQRNNGSEWTHGRFLVANNLCYWNGYSGVHTNAGKRIDFINNTCYYNSYTNTITYADGDQSGKNIGISCQTSDDINMINNIVYIDNTWGGYPISAANSPNIQIEDNMIYGDNGSISQDSDVVAIQINTTISDPLFKDVDIIDFRLQETSPTIGIANINYAPTDDLYGNIRDNDPDLGAIEYFEPTSISEHSDIHHFMAYPNPFKDYLNITGKEEINILEIHSITGQTIQYSSNKGFSERLNVSSLPSGIYIIKINNEFIKLMKK